MESLFGQLENKIHIPWCLIPLGTGKKALTAERLWATQTGIMVNQTIMAVMRIA